MESLRYQFQSTTSVAADDNGDSDESSSGLPPQEHELSPNNKSGSCSNSISYEILGCAEGASPEEVKRAYLRAAGPHHPDLNPNNEMAADHFDKLTLAFAQLSNIGQSYDSFMARQDNKALYDTLFGSSTSDLQQEKKRKQSPFAAADSKYHRKRHKRTSTGSRQCRRRRQDMRSDADELKASLLSCRMKDKLSFQVGSFQISWFLTWIIKNEINPWLTMVEIILTWVVIGTALLPLTAMYFPMAAYYIPNTSYLVSNVVGAMAIMWAQLILHCWYGFVHYPSIWHLAVTSESLNERFNDTRDVCSTFYNRDDTHKPSQYGAIITTLPFTLLNHFATYVVSSCCCLVQTFSECKSFILNSSRRRKGAADPPQNLNIVESLSSSSGVALEQNTVIIRALGTTLVIWGLAFLRLVGGVRFTALTTVLFLVNQHLYNALLFRKPFHCFLLSIVFGNLFVIQRVKQSKKEGSNGGLTYSENHDTDEEMGLSPDDAYKTVEADNKNDGSEGDKNSIVLPNESWPEMRSYDFTPWASEKGGEIKETWGFARQKARKAGIPLEIHEVEPQQINPKRDSKSPNDFDICLDYEKHPGTIAWRQAVRRVAEEGSKSKHAIRTRKDLKKLLKGRQYFVRCPPSISSSTWRKASLLEVRKRCKQCFEEEMRKIEMETMLKEELENTPNEEESVQNAKPRTTHDWVGGRCHRTIAGSPSKDNSLLLELLQTFTESRQEGADNNSSNNDNNNNNNDNNRHESRNAHGVASSLSAGTFSKDASEYETATATSFSPVTPSCSLRTFGTDIYEQQSTEGTETTEKWVVGGDDQSYILENVGNSETLSTTEDGDKMASDALGTVDTMCSGPQPSFDIAQCYLDAMDQSLGSPANVGSSDDLDMRLLFQTRNCDTMKSFKTVSTAPLRAVSTTDVEEQKKKRLVLQREQIIINRQREAQRKLEKELVAIRIKHSGDNTGVFSLLHWNPVSKRRKRREIKECKRQGAINLLNEMSELEGRMDSDSPVAEEGEKREAPADRTPKSRSTVTKAVESVILSSPREMVEGNEPSRSSCDVVSRKVPGRIQESRQNIFVIGKLQDGTKVTENDTEETLDPEQPVVDPKQPISASDWRASLHCKMNESTVGDSEQHFSSVYRKMKRDLESKHYKGYNNKNKNDTSAEKIPGLDVSPLPPLGPPTTVIAQIVPHDDYSELTFDTASRISGSSEDSSLPGCDYAFGL